VKEARNQSQIVNKKSISRNTTHRQSLNLQAMLRGEMLEGYGKGRESKQFQDWSDYIITPTPTTENLKFRRTQIIVFTGTSKLTSVI